jgi:hypothetical protein
MPLVKSLNTYANGDDQLVPPQQLIQLLGRELLHERGIIRLHEVVRERRF